MNLQSLELLDISPNRIFNCDESAFLMCAENKSVFAEKGAVSVYNIVGSSDKQCFTVLVMGSASGTMPPPMVLFESKTVPKKEILNKLPEDWGVCCTENGWMTADSFYCYITNVFYKWLLSNNVQLPVILYLDGHSLHISLPLYKFCMEKKIELVNLYPNATHILQPLDVGLFHSLKVKYRDVLLSWRIQNNVINFKKEMFAGILKLALEKIDFVSIMKNAFKRCGLYPFNSDAVSYDVLCKRKKKTNNVQASEKLVASNTDKFSKFESFLRFFETDIIKSDTLDKFKLFEEALIGSENEEISDEALYECWSKLRRMCGKSLKKIKRSAQTDAAVIIDERKIFVNKTRFGDKICDTASTNGNIQLDTMSEVVIVGNSSVLHDSQAAVLENNVYSDSNDGNLIECTRSLSSSNDIIILEEINGLVPTAASSLQKSMGEVVIVQDSSILHDSGTVLENNVYSDSIISNDTENESDKAVLSAFTNAFTYPNIDLSKKKEN